jgi:hypothetical protein
MHISKRTKEQTAELNNIINDTECRVKEIYERGKNWGN